MDAMQILRQAGFKGDALRTAYAVMMAESGGRARAHNPNRSTGDDSYGLFQINMLDSLGPARRKQFGLGRNEDLFDPVTNARVAYRMSGGGKDWSPWSAYKSGAYKKHLKGGKTEIAYGGSSAPGVAHQAGAGGGRDLQRQALLGMLAQRSESYARGEIGGGPSGLQMLTQARAMRSMDASSRGVEFNGDQGVQVKGGKAMKGTLEEAFHDPLGGFDNGKRIGAIGGHGKHVHAGFNSPKSALAAIKLAKSMGLNVRENPYTDPVDPVHTKGSFHYRNFPGKYNGRTLGMGMDVSGDPRKMAEFYRTVTRLYG